MHNLVTTIVANATLVLLGHGDSLLGWSTAWNVPSLGNSLAISSEPAPCSNLSYFNVSYNFTSNLTNEEALELDPFYATATLTVPNVTALTFHAYNPSTVGVQVIFTATDSSGKVHGTYPRIPPGWTAFSFPLNESTWTPAGAPWVLPLTQISLGPTRVPPFATDVGWLGFADIALETAAPPSAVHVPVSFFLSQPAQDTGGVLVAGEGAGPLPLGALVTNRLPVACDVTVSVQLRNSTGPMGEGASSHSRLGLWKRPPRE